MGLRINTNVSAIRALRTLGINDRNQSKSLERLSTGLRINRGSDDPSGLIISELIRAQVKALDQAVSNSQNASNLVSIADNALDEVSNLLISIQDSVVFAMNTGGSSPDQIAAEQDTVDSAIASIDRIASTTRYGDRSLLNGNADYQLVQSAPSQLQNLTIRSVNFAPGALTKALSVTVTQNPQRAAIRVLGASAAAGATIRITGGRGTADVTFASGASVASMASAINTQAGVTGVYASGLSGNLLLRSEEFGQSQLIKLEGVSGTLSANNLSSTAFSIQDNSSNIGAYAAFSPTVGATLTAGEIVSDRGRDGQVTSDGTAFTGIGRKFSILTGSASFEFDINPDDVTTVDSSVAALVNSGSAISFTVGKTALSFQLNELSRPTDTLEFGIKGVNTNKLGVDRHIDRIGEAAENYDTATATIYKGGKLNTVQTGGGNDLNQSPGNALEIIRGSISSVASLRGFLGAEQAHAIEPNTRALGVSIENLSASLSDLRDLDFAEETAAFTRNQILFQSGIAVMASANLIPQSVLTLLS